MERTIQVRISVPRNSMWPSAWTGREAISLRVEGEDLAELGFAADPTILATLELQAAAGCRNGPAMPEDRWPMAESGRSPRADG
jgi:hypothetical protein